MERDVLRAVGADLGQPRRQLREVDAGGRGYVLLVERRVSVLSHRQKVEDRPAAVVEADDPQVDPDPAGLAVEPDEVAVVRRRAQPPRLAEALDGRVLVGGRQDDGRVFFLLDSSDLDDTGRAVVTSNVEVLKKNPQWVVTIEGHCDERGTNEYNLALGERRAVAVKTYLVSKGVSADRMTTAGYAWDRIERAQDFLRRRGGIAVFLGRFTAFFRAMMSVA